MDALRALMLKQDWTTIDLVWRESPDVFQARNPFPVGGVFEDAATGAAAAAFGGYLRELGLVPGARDGDRASGCGHGAAEPADGRHPRRGRRIDLGVSSCSNTRAARVDWAGGLPGGASAAPSPPVTESHLTPPD